MTYVLYRSFLTGPGQTLSVNHRVMMNSAITFLMNSYLHPAYRVESQIHAHSCSSPGPGMAKKKGGGGRDVCPSLSCEHDRINANRSRHFFLLNVNVASQSFSIQHNF